MGAGAGGGALQRVFGFFAATEARLQAERVGAERIDFSHPALGRADDPDTAAIIGQQIHQFETRRANDETRIGVLNQQIAQLGQQIEGAKRQLTGVKRQRALIAAIRTAQGWGATVVLVAHAPRVLQPATKLLFMRDGRSELFGDRDAVLAKLRPVSAARPAPAVAAADPAAQRAIAETGTGS